MLNKCVLTALAAAALSTPGADQRRAARLLNIDVVAVDRRGAPVVDLKPAEFEVWINGHQIPIQTVSFVSPTDAQAQRTIVVLLDDMALRPDGLPRVREAARQLVKSLSAGESMAIVSLNGDMMESTDDRARLFKAIDAEQVRSHGPCRGSAVHSRR